MLQDVISNLIAAVILSLLLWVFGSVIKNIFRGKRIFLSMPIASLPNPTSVSELKELAVSLSKDLKLNHKLTVYCAFLTMSDRFDPARKAFRECLTEIRKCNYFVAFLPDMLPTSTYVEIGYALARRKKVLIYHRRDALPYLLKEIETDGIPLLGGRILARRIEVEEIKEGVERLREHGLSEFPGHLDNVFKAQK